MDTGRMWISANGGTDTLNIYDADFDNGSGTDHLAAAFGATLRAGRGGACWPRHSPWRSNNALRPNPLTPQQISQQRPGGLAVAVSFGDSHVVLVFVNVKTFDGLARGIQIDQAVDVETLAR